MPDQQPRIAIVGAGPSGLAAAHRLADTHQVWLFDKRSTVGGVWAASSEQTYDWLETNTPTALFPFPGFPLTDDDWQEESSRQPYVSGRVAQRYYARYARVNRLDEQGRLARLELGTTVVQVSRPVDTAMKASSARWVITVRYNASGYQELLPFERLILASGSFCTPNVPAPLRQAIHSGIIFHSSSFGSPQLASRLSRASKMVILGAGKSAQDLLAYIMRAEKSQLRSIILILPSHGRVSSWPLPHGRGPSYLSRMPLFGSGYLSPWAGPDLPSSWLENSCFGTAIRRYYWSSLAHQAQATYPGLFATSASNTIAPWRHILRSTTRLFPAPSGLSLQGNKIIDLSVLHATVIEVTDNNAKGITITLSNKDEEIETVNLENSDLLLACTGYQPSSQGLTDLFTDAEEAGNLGIPMLAEKETDNEWRLLVEEAIRDARQKVPMLAEIFTEKEILNDRLNTFRLYQHMVPIEQAHTSGHTSVKRDFAVMGLPQTLSASIVADMQARWLSRFFVSDVIADSPRLPSDRFEAMRETAQLVAASLSRYGVQDGRQGTALPLELAWYADHLLKDIKTLPRQQRASRQPFRALSSDDFL